MKKINVLQYSLLLLLFCLISKIDASGNNKELMKIAWLAKQAEHQKRKMEKTTIKKDGEQTKKTKESREQVTCFSPTHYNDVHSSEKGEL